MGELLNFRYVIVCLLVSIPVSAVTGAVGGAVGVLTGSATGDGAPGSTVGLALGAALGGLIVGATLGALLGLLSGLATTLAVGPRTDLDAVSVRSGVAVLVTFLLVLIVVAGISGSLLDGLSWRVPSAWQWVGIVVPAVVAAGLTARAAREIPGLR